MSNHGTRIRYVHDSCRCDLCCKAMNDYYQEHRQNTRAYIADVREWARGLGFELTGRARKPLIDRYNREHPERPYQTEANNNDAGWAS